MMISNTSNKREIKDLQRLLLAVGLMRPKGAAKWKGGVWGDETQRGVLAAYTQLGWDHPVDARWISAPALAAVAAALHVHGVAGQVTSAGVGGGGTIGEPPAVIDALTHTGGQKTFARIVRRRLRVASFAVWLRPSPSTGCGENSPANTEC